MFSVVIVLQKKCWIKCDVIRASSILNILFAIIAGQFRDASLGNVYAEDEDDWDRGNKTFSFKYPETQQRFRWSSLYLIH